MAKNSAVNLDITNNADGFDVSGGTTARKLDVTGADITLTGSGSNVYTFPSSTDTLVGRASTDTLTNKSISLTNNTLTGTSAELATAISDETGSGLLVFATSPTLTTPLLGTPTSGDLRNCTAATATNKGVSELATTAEIDTGTDTARTVTPDGLAGSYAGTKNVQMLVFDFATDCATGNGKFYFHIPAALDGMNLVAIHGEAITAGTTGTMDVQIYNVDNALDMLSTVLTWDSTESGTDTAATPAVINASNDHVNTNDVIRVDVDAVQTTAAKGMLITLTFRLP